MELEKGLLRLQEIADSLNNKTTTFDDGIVLFEEGLNISKVCMKKLKEQKGKITKIKAEMDEFIETTFDEEG